MYLIKKNQHNSLTGTFIIYLLVKEMNASKCILKDRSLIYMT